MLPEYPSEDMDYSYTLFVDASTKGYGAYLVANDNSAEPAKIPWFVHPWDESRSDLNLKDSAFVEFYGVLGAVYTWKHHFREKKILVCTDNMEVVTRIEDGLSFSQKHHQRLKKMFQVFKHIFISQCSLRMIVVEM